MNAKTDFSENITKALVVLHNSVREREGYNFLPRSVLVQCNKRVRVVKGGKQATNFRDYLASYFEISVGGGRWQ